jgi:ribosomal protein S6
MEQKNNNYELSFWFSSRLEEKAIEQKFDNLLKQLEKSGALIIFSQSPQLKQLAYPIKKERNAYFGYIRFELSRGSLARLEEGLRLNHDFIRFMVLNIKPKQEEKIPRSTFSKPVFREVRSKKEERMKEGLKEGKVISLEELDKKLSEILKEE